MSDEKAATYLGDGLYVKSDDNLVELFTHDGIGKTNQVFLEPAVLKSFIAWLKNSQYQEFLK